MNFSAKLLVLFSLFFVFSGCPTELEDPQDDPKEEEDDCDIDVCPTCADNCERIAA